ncbi:hypothetical protein [Helicobacter vulpis]|uniref:hypothetical protein n=1 Tax=Helicobacter vulpis TaxID=2316076 RepID=UPI000EB343DE|nr:hypothetical protein [Helicobacter vulpis]
MHLKVSRLMLLAFMVFGISLLSAYPSGAPVNFLGYRQVFATYFMRTAIASHNLTLQGDHSTLFTGKICDSVDTPHYCYILRTLVLSKFEKLARGYQGKAINLENNGMPKLFSQATKEVVREFERNYPTGIK